MPWPGFKRQHKPAQTDNEEVDDDEEFLPNASSPFLRGMSNARYALCGPKAACSCTTATFVFMITKIIVFCCAFFLTAAAKSTATVAAAGGALLGPSQCQLAASGGLWPASLRYHFAAHQLLTATFLHASFLHLIVSLCTLMRYGLSFEHRRSIGELVVLILSAGVLGGLVSSTTIPNSVLVCGGMAAFALMGDETVIVLFAGGCSMFDGHGSRRKRRLPYRLLCVGCFGMANVTVLLFAGGAVSVAACLACFAFGGIATASEYPSRRSRTALLDHGEGTGDHWAWWKRQGWLIGIGAICLLFAAAVLGFEGATTIVDRPAPVC